MIGTIPNPQKSILIESDSQSIKKVIPLISLLNPKYKSTESDDILKQYTFEATEFLSLGVYIDINLSDESENKTKVSIEVKRKVGAFDKAHEVQYGNEHIDKIFKLISKGLTMSKDEIESLKTAKKEETALKESEKNKNKKTNKIISSIILIAVICVSGYYIKSNYDDKQNESLYLEAVDELFSIEMNAMTEDISEKEFDQLKNEVYEKYKDKLDTKRRNELLNEVSNTRY